MNWPDCCGKYEHLTHELEKKLVNWQNSLKVIIHQNQEKNPGLISIREIESITYNFLIMKTSRLRGQSTLSFPYLRNK